MDGIEGRRERRGWWSIALAALVTGVVPAWTPGAEARELDSAHESRVVFVLERQRDDLHQLARAVSDPHAASYGRYLPVERVAATYGASADVFAHVEDFLERYGASAEIDVTRTFATAVLDEAQVEAIFGKHPSHVPPVPDELRDVVPIVVGSFAKASTGTALRVRREPPPYSLALDGTEAWPPWNMGSGTPAPCPSGGLDACTCGFPNPGPPLAFRTFTPDQLRAAYGIEETGLTGRGRTAAVVEFGQSVDPQDVLEYTRGFGRADLPLFQVYVDTSAEHVKPGFEATLDVETLAGIATGFDRLTLLASRGTSEADFQVYGLILYSMALDRNVTGGRLIDVLSSSWLISCEPELDEPAFVEALEAIFQTAAAAGVTVAVAAGDQGSSACTSRNPPYENRRVAVEYPSSSPWVTSVGATSLLLDADNQIADVRAWNDWPLQLDVALPGIGCKTPPCRPEPVWAGSGGRSIYFDRPGWQTGHGVELAGPRQLPDIAFVGDIYPGTAIRLHGHWGTGNGTSQATPIFGAITLLLNEEAAAQRRPRLGFANPLLYSLARREPGVFYDVIDGDNVIGDNEKRFDVDCCFAGPGYDMASGWGSLHVGRVLDALTTRLIPIRPANRLPVVRGALRSVIGAER